MNLIENEDGGPSGALVEEGFEIGVADRTNFCRDALVFEGLGEFVNFGLGDEVEGNGAEFGVVENALASGSARFFRDVDTVDGLTRFDSFFDGFEAENDVCLGHVESSRRKWLVLNVFA